MTHGEYQSPAEEDDDLLPRLFRAVGPRPTLPEDMKRSWESVFSRELMKNNAARRRRRGYFFAAACASVLAIAGAIVYLQPATPVDPPVAQIESVFGPVEGTDGKTTQPLHEGAQLGAGETVRVGPRAYLALRYHDADVRLNSGTVMVVHPTRLELVSGQTYIDAGRTPRPGPMLEVQTRYGMLAHVGTQFSVYVGDDEMRAAVREGSVAMDAAGERRVISAADGPTEVVVSSRGTVTTRPISGTGAMWAWVVDSAPQYAMDGRNADEFLAWATRQLGAKLEYTNDATHVHAQTVMLHGDVRALSVAQGLSVLAATTDLDIDQSDPSVIHVRTREPGE